MKKTTKTTSAKTTKATTQNKGPLADIDNGKNLTANEIIVPSVKINNDVQFQQFAEREDTNELIDSITFNHYYFSSIFPVYAYTFLRVVPSAKFVERLRAERVHNAIMALSKMFTYTVLNRCIEPNKRMDIAVKNGSKSMGYHMHTRPTAGSKKIVENGAEVAVNYEVVPAEDNGMYYNVSDWQNNETETVDTGLNTSNNGFSAFAVNARNSIYHDCITLDNIEYWSNLFDFKQGYYQTKNELTRPTAGRKKIDTAINQNVIGKTLGDGMDYLQNAYATVLQFLEVTDYCLNSDVTWKKPDKHIVFDFDYEPVYKTEVIPACMAILRIMRMYVELSRGARYDETSKYSYCSLDETYDEYGNKLSVYYRTTIYANIGGYITSINGTNYGMYTTSLQDIIDSRELAEFIETLPRVQQAICKQIFKGYSIHHTATILGVARTNIYNDLKRVRAKIMKKYNLTQAQINDILERAKTVKHDSLESAVIDRIDKQQAGKKTVKKTVKKQVKKPVGNVDLIKSASISASEKDSALLTVGTKTLTYFALCETEAQNDFSARYNGIVSECADIEKPVLKQADRIGYYETVNGITRYVETDIKNNGSLADSDKRKAKQRASKFLSDGLMNLTTFEQWKLEKYGKV